MPNKIEVEHIQLGKGTLAQMFKLPQRTIDYLWERIEIAKKKQVSMNKMLAGHISHSYLLEDPQKLVVQTLFKIVCDPDSNPKMYEFINTDIESVYRKIDSKEFGLEPYLDNMWVNFQKKGEFQPVHSHSGALSFVIWMDIPYHPKDEDKLPFTRSNASGSTCGNFSFAFYREASRSVFDYLIKLSPEKNGYCCIFPSDLSHQVYPFYTSDKDRISISGNIKYRTKEPNPPQVYQFPFHTSETWVEFLGHEKM